MIQNIISKIKPFLLSVLNKIRPFYFDNNALEYKRMNGWLIVVILFFSFLTFLLGWKAAEKNEIARIKNYEAEERLVIIKNGDKFSEEKLILFIKELNFKWPEIVYAQARLESGSNYNSDVNIQNNNYFGMKNANIRINTQNGENIDHATYMNWRMSVIDYALYCATYLSDFKTKSEYYNYLERVYCTTPGYINRVIALEKEYFEKLDKITAKNSYDIFEQEQLDSIPDKHKPKKSNAQTTSNDSLVFIQKKDSVQDSIK